MSKLRRLRDGALSISVRCNPYPVRDGALSIRVRCDLYPVRDAEKAEQELLEVMERTMQTCRRCPQCAINTTRLMEKDEVGVSFSCKHGAGAVCPDEAATFEKSTGRTPTLRAAKGWPPPKPPSKDIPQSQVKTW